MWRFRAILLTMPGAPHASPNPQNPSNNQHIRRIICCNQSQVESSRNTCVEFINQIRPSSPWGDRHDYFIQLAKKRRKKIIDIFLSIWSSFRWCIRCDQILFRGIPRNAGIHKARLAWTDVFERHSKRSVPARNTMLSQHPAEARALTDRKRAPAELWFSVCVHSISDFASWAEAVQSPHRPCFLWGAGHAKKWRRLPGV